MNTTIVLNAFWTSKTPQEYKKYLHITYKMIVDRTPDERLFWYRIQDEFKKMCEINQNHK